VQVIAPRVLRGEPRRRTGPVDGQQSAELPHVAGHRDPGQTSAMLAVFSGKIPEWTLHIPAASMEVIRAGLLAGHGLDLSGHGRAARTMAECRPSATSWVAVMLIVVKPACASPSRYSAKDRAPVMAPT
jgi:hypothetical protein